MPVTVTCQCGKQLRIRDEHVGKKVRCPECQTVFTAVAEVEEAGYGVQEEPPARPAREVQSSSGRRRAPTRCHEIDYEIIGDDLQLVEIELDPDEVVIAEAGAMTYMEEDIEFTTKMGDGSDPNQGFFGKLMSAGKRALSGDSIFLTHFTNAGEGKRRVAFAAPYPGKILPLNLADIGEELICQKGAFLCAALGTKLDIAFQKKLGAGLFGGEGFVLQRIQGDGYAFVHACGAVVKRELEGETLRVDTGCLVAFTSGIEYDIQRAGNLKSMFFGGEGLFLATLSGTGTVWLQSLPFSRLADRILANAPSAGGSSREAGSLLGGLGSMLTGERE